MIQLREIHLCDGSSYDFANYVERLDYANLEVPDHFGVDNFGFLTNTSELTIVPSNSVRVVKLDVRKRIRRVESNLVSVKIMGIGQFDNCSIIDKADYAFANIPRLFVPQLVWSSDAGTYIANVQHVISVVDSDRVRTSKVVPRNALHVKNES